MPIAPAGPDSVERKPIFSSFAAFTPNETSAASASVAILPVMRPSSKAGDSNHFVVQCLMPFRARIANGKPLGRDADAAAVKRRALELGADLAGIASAATLNALTPEFGPRVYLTGVLTELELEPNERITEQVCIGESCSRCLHSCPPNAVLHWGIDKRGCATEAQEFGFMTMLQFMERVIDAPPERRSDMLKTRDLFGFWQGLLRVVGSFGDCPRCLAVCPVGNDYHAHLADVQKHIPERTPEKEQIQQRWREARKRGEPIPGLSEWNARWVGPDGYKGIVARQLYDFNRQQK